MGANLTGANLLEADLGGADLDKVDLSDANLGGANLNRAVLVETKLVGADLTGCRVYGISAWDVQLSEGTKQQDLVITPPDEPAVVVDNIEVAQFVYLLLHNEKIRDVIDTVGRKGVLLLGRFTEGRIAVLERLREALRQRGYLPIVFNFDKPETKDFTETIRILAGLSHFVIADVTNPKSAPLELQAIIPEIMVPFRPIIEEGEEPFAMLTDLWIKHREWVFEPLYYSSLDGLVLALDERIIRPAEARFIELLARKAERMKGEHV
jgi:Pentapeptide repeats (8 copies)